MTSEREAAGGRVLAVAVDDGRLLQVTHGDGGPWTLPSGTAEPAGTPGATAERAVYELTGYLVDAPRHRHAVGRRPGGHASPSALSS
ncbi:NUDIX domain-containing protein [Streptomyces sp. NPDC058459]|uniref:NUDIX domain-containing protein n=1 Tax=Streptomyces sp. NPDC058459 TaxID=3346508 RepID=UPI003656CA4B